MKIRILLAATAALSAVASMASAQATGTAPVKANIVTPITVAHVAGTELNFGTLSRTGVPAVTAVVTQAGARGTTAGVTPSGAVDVAEFTITGNAGQVVTISAAPVTLVTGVVVTPDVGDGTETLGAGGTFPLSVGGTLEIASGQAVTAASLEGTMTVTVNYQ